MGLTCAYFGLACNAAKEVCQCREQSCRCLLATSHPVEMHDPHLRQEKKQEVVLVCLRDSNPRVSGGRPWLYCPGRLGTHCLLSTMGYYVTRKSPEKSQTC